VIAASVADIAMSLVEFGSLLVPPGSTTPYSDATGVCRRNGQVMAAGNVSRRPAASTGTCASFHVQVDVKRSTFVALTDILSFHYPHGHFHVYAWCVFLGHPLRRHN